MPQSSRSRVSRYLFQFEASDGCDANGMPIARSGQMATFTRGGTGGASMAVDANGGVYIAGGSSPRYHHQYDAVSGLFKPAGLLLESDRENLVIQSDAITAANGWTLQPGVTTTADFARCGSLSLTRIVSGGNAVFRNVTLTSNGKKAVSQVVQFDGATGQHDCCCLYDNTTSAPMCYARVVWAADGTATITGIVGVLLGVERLALGTYRILMQSLVTTTAAHDMRIYPILDVSSAISVRTAGMQVEESYVFPSSSVISTTTATVMRTRDVLSFPLNLTPRVVSLYLRFLDGGATLDTDELILCAIGEFPQFSLQNTITGTGGYLASVIAPGIGLTSPVAVQPAMGDLVELLAWVYADGSIQLSQSINGAAAVVGARSAAGVLASVWGDPVISLAQVSGGATAAVVQACRVAAGITTLAQMRAA